ncbi:aminotransferase family protein [Anaeromyxobacter terrae]|uniref:aminotransferase family protein n=1 Tax=Anaeromyxobacter terrae TaxID=2925406 RepID=UPI001F568D90|nr:aminotransferase class III-fold pyridoxal phosphate-dependent enzyme [Anaeromyxobacter sp. SG22]
MSAFRYPESNVFYRKLGRSYPLVVRGEGAWLVDSEGRRYLDASGGAFVANLGHGVREIGEAMAEQAAQIAYVNGTAFTTEPVEALAAELSRLLPPPLDKLYFLCSGSEAVEAALKLARQHWVEVGRPSKHKIIALTPAYHGNTLLALSASAREHYKTCYREWLVDVHRIPAPYAYRCRCGGVPSEPCAVCDGSVLEVALDELGADQVAAFIAEPVGGSSTGHSVPRGDYFRRIREICDRREILFIADEVLVGAGRTGTWWAIEQFGVAPDIMVLGKGITGGYAPLSAVATSRRVIDPIAKGSGAMLHAQTFSHHPVLAAAGLAAVRHVERHGLVERCRRMGALLHARLEALRELPYVGDVRGRGLLAGVELVADKATRAPFPRRLRFAETLSDAALRAGLMTWTNVGQANGVDGDVCCLAPPFVISDSEIDDLTERFTVALNQAVERVRHG